MHNRNLPPYRQLPCWKNLQTTIAIVLPQNLSKSGVLMVGWWKGEDEVRSG